MPKFLSTSEFYSDISNFISYLQARVQMLPVVTWVTNGNVTHVWMPKRPQLWGPICSSAAYLLLTCIYVLDSKDTVAQPVPHCHGNGVLVRSGI